MQIHLQKGGALRVGLPSLHHAIDDGLKRLPALVDAQFLSIHSTELPRVTRGFGIAHALASVARGTAVGIKDIEADIKRIKASAKIELDAAKRAVDDADKRTLFLSQLADFVERGTALPDPDLDLRLHDAAKILRNASMLGDPEGLVAATVEVLRTEVESQILQIARAKGLLRRRAATVNLAIENQTADVWKRAASSAGSPDCLLPLAEKKAIAKRATDSADWAERYTRAYHKVFYQNDGRIPQVRAAPKSRITRAKNGSLTLLKEFK